MQALFTRAVIWDAETTSDTRGLGIVWCVCGGGEGEVSGGYCGNFAPSCQRTQ